VLSRRRRIAREGSARRGGPPRPTIQTTRSAAKPALQNRGNGRSGKMNVYSEFVKDFSNREFRAFPAGNTS